MFQKISQEIKSLPEKYFNQPVAGCLLYATISLMNEDLSGGGYRENWEWEVWHVCRPRRH